METKLVNKGGRPSLYKPEYCQMIIESGMRGEYTDEFIAQIGIKDSKTLINWGQQYPEFEEARIKAAWFRRAYRLKLARQRMEEGKSHKEVLWDAHLVGKTLRVAGLDGDAEDLGLVLNTNGNTYNIQGDINQTNVQVENFNKLPYDEQIKEITDRLKNAGVVIDV